MATKTTVYVEAPANISRGIVRVATALKQYAPADIECVPTMDEAEVVLIHTIGWEGDLAERLLAAKKRIAFFMYCLRTTQRPHAEDWYGIWSKAEVVASYYHLAAVSDLPVEKFLHTPLGVDTTIFYPRPDQKRDFLVGTSGFVDGMEIIGEWAWVVGSNGGRMFHLGPHLKLPNAAVKYRHGIPDDEVAEYWSQCRYVSGLRRTEGFELPAYEGLACGARPVMFAREDAEHWLGDSAEYIQEGSVDDVVAQLEALVQREYRPVTADEIAWVGREFSWQRMAERFWSAVPR